MSKGTAKNYLYSGFIILIFLCGIIRGEAIIRSVPDTARPIPLSKIRLTGGPLKTAQDLDAKYLLELEPDRMMAGLRMRAGLDAKARVYGGWDSFGGRSLIGHIAGHYLSASSLMYAVTGDVRFKERVDYIIKEMKEVQDARGDGYLGAITNDVRVDARDIFIKQIAEGKINAALGDLNGLWAPFYVFHKTFAGLRDAYRYTGNKDALDIEIKFARWVETTLSKLDEKQIQQMLTHEFGGMNEVLADLYADTGDKRWLELSYKFEHKAFIEPLARRQDMFGGTHANSLVPKVIGSAVRYGYDGNSKDLDVASFFADGVINHHTFSTGGFTVGVRFSYADTFNNGIENPQTNESCPVYNMLKLVRRLFAYQPLPYYADYIERALFNHILGSFDPNTSQMCFNVPSGMGVVKDYQDMSATFCCCIGTGMESHALHGNGIYYEATDKFWVNLYVPSTVEWDEAGIKMEMETDFPEGESAKLKMSIQSSKEWTLLLRRPYWTGNGFNVKVNGQIISIPSVPDIALSRRGVSRKPAPQVSSYVEIKRTWQNGDTIEITLPKTLRLEPCPDNTGRAAIMWGPLVLAGDLGPERRAASSNEKQNLPVIVTEKRTVSDWLKPVAEKTGEFWTDGVGKPVDVNFVPFYRLHRRTYSVYFDFFSSADWERRQAELKK